MIVAMILFFVSIYISFLQMKQHKKDMSLIKREMFEELDKSFGLVARKVLSDKELV